MPLMLDGLYLSAAITLTPLMLTGCGESRPSFESEAKARALLQKVEDFYADKQEFAVEMDVEVAVRAGSESCRVSLLSERGNRYRQEYSFPDGRRRVQISDGTGDWRATSEARDLPLTSFREGPSQCVWKLSVCAPSTQGQVVLALHTPGWTDRITEHSTSVWYLGEEKMKDGRRAYHVRIEREDRVQEQLRLDYRDLWIAIGNAPVILRQESELHTETYDHTGGYYQFEFEESTDFDEWDFEPEIPEDAFVVPASRTS